MDAEHENSNTPPAAAPKGVKRGPKPKHRAANGRKYRPSRKRKPKKPGPKPRGSMKNLLLSYNPGNPMGAIPMDEHGVHRAYSGFGFSAGDADPYFVPLPIEHDAVRAAAAAGLAIETIARMIRPNEGGISVRTLKRHFQHDLETGTALAQTACTSTILRMAQGGIPALPADRLRAATTFLRFRGPPDWRRPQTQPSNFGQPHNPDFAVDGPPQPQPGGSEEFEEHYNFTVKIGENEPTEER